MSHVVKSAILDPSKLKKDGKINWSKVWNKQRKEKMKITKSAMLLKKSRLRNN